MLNMIIRMVMRKLVAQGVNGAFKMGGAAVKNRAAKRAAMKQGPGPELEQDPAVSQRRRRHADERRGDEVLYPTDDFTEDMQPRK